MNHKFHYDNLIQTRKTRLLEKDVYYEKHHIVMKSMGGSNDHENLVYLTPKEHFIAHLLLDKIHDNWKTKSAIGYMCANYTVSSRMYAISKMMMSASAKERHSLKEGIGTYGIKYSQETRDKMSNSIQGLKRSVTWKHSVETIELMKSVQNSRSEEWKQNLKLNHPHTKSFLNRSHSEDTIARMKKNMLGKKKTASKKQCPHCLKEGACSGFYRWHFEKCKMKQ